MREIEKDGIVKRVKKDEKSKKKDIKHKRVQKESSKQIGWDAALKNKPYSITAAIGTFWGGWNRLRFAQWFALAGSETALFKLK